MTPKWGGGGGMGGRVTWLYRLSQSYFLIPRSDEMFADSSVVAHPVHCKLRRPRQELSRTNRAYLEVSRASVADGV